MMIKSAIRDLVARVVAGVVPPGLFRDKRYFRLWQEHGYHITPVHFYEALPDTRSLKDEVWAEPSEMVGIDMNEARQLELLSEFAARYKTEYDGIDPMDKGTPDWEALYGMVRHFRPRRVIEVGSGVSTRVAVTAIQRNRRDFGIDAALVAIEPFPDEELVRGFPGLAELRRTPVQDVPMAEFERLGEDDILFIDSTHVLTIGSDVRFEFLEVIPRLKKGVLVHIHDIFFPFDYPRAWAMERAIFWNEAYLLQAFLAFNSSFEVLLSNSYLHHRHPSAMQHAFGRYRPDEHRPGSFWMRRIR